MFATLVHPFHVWESLRREAHKEETRSPRWPHARDEYLKTHKTCAACGSSTRLQVHHVEPFHLHPELELDQANFIALCMDTNECHLKIGHGDDFKAWNPKVREHSAASLKNTKMISSYQALAKACRLQAEPSP